ncbi:MAG TPA: hypothetical protein VN743_10195, partial [Blastocatellia bacterium]|nr:hypothetical protein [Blastocatellia bacterium]
MSLPLILLITPQGYSDVGSHSSVNFIEAPPDVRDIMPKRPKTSLKLVGLCLALCFASSARASTFIMASDDDL